VIASIQNLQNIKYYYDLLLFINTSNMYQNEINKRLKTNIDHKCYKGEES